MSSIHCIKEESREEILYQILSLCDNYIYFFPKDWENIFGKSSIDIYLWEKLVTIINRRFLSELLALCPNDSNLQELLSQDYHLALYRNDMYHTSSLRSGDDDYSILQYGDDLLYFSEVPLHGLCISENNSWFSFYQETVAIVGYYNLEEEDYLEKFNEQEVFERFFPQIIEEDLDFIHYCPEYIESIHQALYDEADNTFLIHTCKKLFHFKQWVEKNGNEKFPECQKLLLCMEWLKKPMSNTNLYHYVETEKNIYLCYHYFFDSNYGIQLDGKFFFPTHFYTMVSIEVLLKLIEIKFKTSFSDS